MKNKKLIMLLMLTLAGIILFCGCASSNPEYIKRVNEALDKSMETVSQHIKGNIEINMSAAGQSIDMGIDFDAKVASPENMVMSMQITGLMNMSMDMYGIDGKFYMYMPQFSDKYIDVSSEYEQQTSNTFVDMSMFDFDTDKTSMSFAEDSKTGSLRVDVKLNDEQMKNLIKKVYAEQNKGSGTISGSNNALDMLESMHVDSANYTIYIDKDNNIYRFELTAKISVEISRQKAEMEMTANYDVLETGDSVKVDLPDIQPGNVISYEELLGGLS